MSAGESGSNSNGPEFPEGPDEENNEEFLDDRLETLRQKYSYERLSDLSAVRLGAVEGEGDGLSEEDFLHKEFKRLYSRFPDEEDNGWRRWALGQDYRGFAPLTLEQKQRIQECHHECSRNLDRARQDALNREDFSGPFSNFANWLVDFAEAATPIINIQK